MKKREFDQDNTSTIILRLEGGLGNQLFQYAHALHLQQQLNGANIVFETTKLDSKSVTNRKNRLVEIGIQHPEIKDVKFDSLFLRCKFIRVLKRGTKGVFSNFFLLTDSWYYYPKSKKRKINLLLDGYFQNIFFFNSSKEKIVKAYQNLRTNLALSENTVSIHIRRSDYQQVDSIHSIVDEDYYHRAMERISYQVSSPEWHVFSDDFNVAKKIFPINSCHFHDSALYTDLDHLRMMISCRHHIIANSSFSWWGAYLTKEEGITIAPANWYKNKQVNSKVKLPNEWVIL